MGQEEEDHYLRMMADLNCQPFACKANALPIELIILYFFHSLLAPNFIYTRSAGREDGIINLASKTDLFFSV